MSTTGVGVNTFELGDRFSAPLGPKSSARDPTRSVHYLVSVLWGSIYLGCPLNWTRVGHSGGIWVPSGDVRALICAFLGRSGLPCTQRMRAPKRRLTSSRAIIATRSLWSGHRVVWSPLSSIEGPWISV